jgi:hypothetical protein
MDAYLFVHFKEKRSPDGEQVYFGVSRDGYTWEQINGGDPVLWCYFGDKGVRDCTIVRTKENKFVIVGTDLSLAYGMIGPYNNSWKEVSENGSKHLSCWMSEDLVNWSIQKLIKFDDDFGCLWAPDIIYDKVNEDYILHWSSAHKSDNYFDKKIYYSRTKDFVEFSDAEVLFEIEPGSKGIIDSAMYEEDGRFYLYYKSIKTGRIELAESDSVTGPFVTNEGFSLVMDGAQHGYEAPTAVKAKDGRWCLFVDFYNCPKEEQGYVPFVADKLSDAAFTRAEGMFSFPYKFKHGTLLSITNDEYERLKGYKKMPSDC